MVTVSSGLPGMPLSGSQASGQCINSRSKYSHPKSLMLFSQDALQATIFFARLFFVSFWFSKVTCVYPFCSKKDGCKSQPTGVYKKGLSRNFDGCKTYRA